MSRISCFLFIIALTYSQLAYGFSFQGKTNFKITIPLKQVVQRNHNFSPSFKVSQPTTLGLKVAKVEKIDLPKKDSPIQSILYATKQIKTFVLGLVSSAVALVVNILVFLRITTPKAPSDTTTPPKKETLDSVMKLAPEDPSRFSDTQISVTIAPPSSTASTKSTPAITTLASTGTVPKEKPANWVVRKLNEIRSRDTVVAKVTSAASPLVETGGVTPKTIQQRLQESAVPIPEPLPEVTPTTSNSKIAAVKDAISAAGGVLSSSKASEPPVASPVATAAVVAAPIASAPVVEETSKLTADVLKSVDVLHKSVHSADGVAYQAPVYGSVDTNAVNVKLTPELFQLPTIDIEGADEWIKAGDNVKKAGISGAIAYAISEAGFWIISFPIIYASYHSTTGEWLSLANPDDRALIIGLSAGFASAARLALPLRFAAAVALIPTVDKYITKPFIAKESNNSKVTE